MIPRLHVAINNNITQMRCIGRIDRARECVAKETTNGEYNLELTTDIEDFTAPNLTTLKFISAKPNPFDPEQFFIVTKTERTIQGTIKAYADHIHSLCNQICTDNVQSYTDEKENQYTSQMVADVWYKLTHEKLPAGITMPFTFSSNITTKADFWLGTTKAETFGNIMSANEGGFLSVYGGEYKYNNLAIQLLARRGAVKNFVLRYGSNISDATQTEDTANMYSHVLAYGAVKDGIHEDKTINLSAAPVEITGHMCPIPRTFMYDCTEKVKDFVVYPSHKYDGSIIIHYAGEGYPEARAEMQAAAQAYAANENLGKPNISINVTHRSELDEMKQIALGDTVTVVLDNLGTTATARVSSVEYDVLNERWNSLQVGESKVTLARILLNQQKYLKGTFR